MTHILQRRGTAAQWASVNPVLMLGEVGWETDTRKSKLGDGATAWSALPYTESGGVVTSVAGRTGNVVLSRTDVGLTAVDNTADLAKPVSVATQAALDAKAPLASPVFTGDPKAPTPATADNDTSIATTAFVKAQAYAPLASPALSGAPTAPTAGASDDSLQIATTAHVKAAIAAGRQTGSGSFPPQTVASGAAATGTITFPVAFSGTPKVFIVLTSTNGGADFFVPRTQVVSATSFTWVFYNVSSVSQTTPGTTTFSWLAVL